MQRQQTMLGRSRPAWTLDDVLAGAPADPVEGGQEAMAMIMLVLGLLLLATAIVLIVAVVVEGTDVVAVEVFNVGLDTTIWGFLGRNRASARTSGDSNHALTVAARGIATRTPVLPRSATRRSDAHQRGRRPEGYDRTETARWRLGESWFGWWRRCGTLMRWPFSCLNARPICRFLTTASQRRRGAAARLC